MRDSLVAPLWLFSLSALASVQVSVASTTDPVSEQHVQHIRDDIPPAIVIENEPAKKTTLTERMAALHVPGVSIAVIHNGALEWARGFGSRKAGGPQVTPDTLFQAASISKPITALAVLRLVDEGKINLDTDANSYLKSWKIPDNEFTQKKSVTVRELLSHTAGITVPGFGGYSPDETLPTLLQVLDGEPPANNPPIRVDIVPNTIWRYAGGGYVILRQIVEDVTGEPFPKFMQDAVLAPAGMAHSYFEQPLSSTHLTTAAVPHDRDGHIVRQGPKIYPEFAPDGLWTTPSDLARYILAVQRSLTGEPKSLLSSSTALAMLTPGKLSQYALGAIVGDDKQNPWFTHNGGNYGYPCLFVAYNRGEGAVVMANGANGFELDIDVLRSIASAYHWPDFRSIRHRTVLVDRKTLAGYVGVYRISADNYVAITLDGKGLSLQSTDHGTQHLFPLTHGEFVSGEPVLNGFLNRDDEMRITFKGKGAASKLTFLVAGGAGKNAERLADAPAKPILDRFSEITDRFKHQVPAAGSERGLQRLIEDISAGKVDHSLVTLEFATNLESIRALNQEVFSKLGPVVSLSFVRAGPTGIDTYRVVFKNGAGDMDTWLNDDSKFSYVQYFPG